ncbi:MAG: DUF421 domain-containing protein [Bryobacteraceae bacterium]
MNTLFHLQVSPWELIVRGTVMYWLLFLLMRFVLRRDAGSLSLADVLMIVFLGSAAQNGISGEYKTIGEAVVLVGTIAFWNYLFDWMAFRYRWFARFAEPRVIPLIRHGRVLKENLRREMLTVEELQGQLRASGIENIGEVKHALLEADGHISVIQFGGSGVRAPRDQGPRGV